MSETDEITCPHCGGSGYGSLAVDHYCNGCSICSGTGKVSQALADEYSNKALCPSCGGTGGVSPDGSYSNYGTCALCNGEGLV